jgi:hypothetical protein
MEWRFAQISDLRLGVKLTWLDGDIASSVRDASRQALVDAFRIAQEHNCEAVLMPGDLYSLKGIDPAGQLRFVYERAADYPSMQFLIAPGNSDAFGGNCPYVYLKPPSNVHLFTEPQWQTYQLPNVAVTARAAHIGEGDPPMVWEGLPRPHPDKLSVLMLRGRLVGAEDGRPHRNQTTQIDVERLLGAGYNYTALGGLHAKIELQRQNGKAAAAYASTPQCLEWEARGPGGFYTGVLTREGAELTFHRTARLNWVLRDILLPPPYADQYQAKLDSSLQELTEGLAERDIYKFAVHGELHEDYRGLLDEHLSKIHDIVFHDEADNSGVKYFSGLNPAKLPSDSLLASYFQRCAAEAAQSGSEPEVYELARRFGWLLFTGKGLPAEISQ